MMRLVGAKEDLDEDKNYILELINGYWKLIN